MQKEVFSTIIDYEVWFALVVSARLYKTALAFAPLSDSMITKFFRPIVNGQIACSA